MNLKNKKANTLIAVLLVIVVLSILGSALMLISINEGNIARRQKMTTVAFHIAEAGIERAIYDLREDFVNDPTSPSWADADINGNSVGPNTSTFYDMGYSGNNLNGGSYSVELKNIVGSGEAIWVRSVGTFENETESILIYAKINNISPWGNAIFAGSGASGALINGNVNIAGSVHILGTGLDPTDFAVDLGGSAELISNNYSQMPSGLKDKVPDLPTVEFGGETVESLSAVLRVKRGIVGLSGSASAGETDNPGDSDKETIDASYVTDGFGGNAAENNVHSDNGWSNGYDLGDTVLFPSLADPYETYASYEAYFEDNALVISDAGDLATLANLTAGSSFTFTDGTNTLSMDGSGNLTIAGQVYVDGGGITFDDKNNTVSYTGTGTILTTGDCLIDTNLVTPGDDSFPNNILGLMTSGEITIGTTAQLDVMGLFYGEDEITIEKQTRVVGTIVSDYFNMGSQVPNIFQVPGTVNNLPAGLIGQDASWYMAIVAWQEE